MEIDKRFREVCDENGVGYDETIEKLKAAYIRRNEDMDMDDYALCVVHPSTAKELTKKEKKIKGVLVITEVVAPHDVIMVPKDEFIDYIGLGNMPFEGAK